MFGLNNDHNQHLLSTCRVSGSPHNHPERWVLSVGKRGNGFRVQGTRPELQRRRGTVGTPTQPRQHLAFGAGNGFLRNLLLHSKESIKEVSSDTWGRWGLPVSWG